MTIRLRLTLGFLAVILLANSILFVVMEGYVRRVLVEQVQARVASNLDGARQIYDDEVEKMGLFLRAAAIRSPAAVGSTLNGEGELCQLLTRLRHEGRMDILTLLGPDGRVICRAHHPPNSGDDLTGNALVSRVMQTQEAARGTLVVPRDVLERDGPELAERAQFEITPTAEVERTDRRNETRGMLIAAAAPMFSSSDPEQMIGILYAANLLNRRYELVDTVRDRAFQQARFEGKPLGTATLFLEDLRIATNVLREDGGRAVGTRLSAAINESVLQQGKTWYGQTFVVNDRYITAYEPIRDPDGRIIGALYVGMLEGPFVRPQETVFYVFLAAMLATTLASMVLLFLVTKRMLRPVDRVVDMSRRVVEGDLSARVGIRPAGEMGLLCQAVDEMADAVAAREQQIKLATSRQIGQSEKLASIGRLAAGVAHEINNPLTGVLTFGTLMREKSNMDDQDREDLDLMIRETTRVRDIVRGLLDFARESPHEKRLLHLNGIIQRTTRLLRNQREFRHIAIVEQLEDHIPWMIGDENQIQQVLLNLALNACEAMAERGTLTIKTFALDGQIIAQLSDTGHGIKPEDINKIFDPFFTTRPAGKGTGLGLSVSYGILQQHNAIIDVATEVGKGTTFTLMFPPAPPEAMDEHPELKSG